MMVYYYLFPKHFQTFLIVNITGSLLYYTNCEQHLLMRRKIMKKICCHRNLYLDRIIIVMIIIFQR